jgi:hypothetical protein
MFKPTPPMGLTANLAHTYRRRKGIDKWPLVEATVLSIKINRDGEGPNTHTLRLRYKPPECPASDTFWVKSLTVNQGTTLSSASVDDKILIHCHPTDPERIAQEDVSQLVEDIRSLFFLAAMALVFIVMFLTGHVTWGGDD